MDSVLDDMAVGFEYLSPLTNSYTYHGMLVDTYKFDIIPKRGYYDDQIKAVEQELVTLERQQESSLKYYENQRKILQERKDKLEREKENKSG